MRSGSTRRMKPEIVKEIGADPAIVLTPELLALVIEEWAKSTPRNHTFALAKYSRAWAVGVSEFVNGGAVGAHVSAGRLRAIKAAARGLDLAWLIPEFLEVAEKHLGVFDAQDYYEYTPPSSEPKIGSVLMGILWAFKQSFCELGDVTKHEVALSQLARSVEQSYRKFLVVKTVEHHARAAGRELNEWTEKCMVSKLVDVFWHCHLLHPQHYLDSSSALLGAVGVIDHDPGYISPRKMSGSDLKSKIDCLYSREKGFYSSVRSMHDEEVRTLLGLHRSQARGIASPYQSHAKSCALPPFAVLSVWQAFVLSKEEEEWLQLAFDDANDGDCMECG